MSGPLNRCRRPLVALTLALALGAAGCGDQRAARPAGSTTELPDQEVSDFVLSETFEGKLQWRLFAQVAASYSARNLIVAQRIRVDFFDEKGDKSSQLTARQGEIHDRTRDMMARGDVVLITTEGTRLSSQELRFVNHSEKILVPEHELVRVERAGDVLTGYGFESDPELRHFEFKREVRATVRTYSGGSIGTTKGESR